ncbi:hypothetical protein GCM10008957_49760 [Deinococcus ruber]|uniref:Uncharacterized protein n=1 Tax=Deinococcus ruber TaxID=1848197 RepID=A0A918CNZ6_9DEIO|nr:hypothetical protein GCM10008957_49760 [Deinococcus ruber]
MLWGGPQIQAEGTIEVKTIPTQQVPISLTRLNVHLGYYIKSREVEVLIDHAVEAFQKQQLQPPLEGGHA